MKFHQLSLILFVIFMPLRLSADIVINEIMYDPIGTDTGYEWIELYNNGTESVDLQGAELQIAGAQFITIYTFSHYLLRPGRFVLIGEANITQAIFITELIMQNGGGETDGVRFISPDGEYSDTVLYDEPNSNHLLDDASHLATAFAPDVAMGISLARRVDGLDTNDCFQDFVPEAYPTPGYPNRVAVDYGMTDCALQWGGERADFSCYLQNHSPADNDSITIILQVKFHNRIIHSFDIQPFSAGHSLFFATPLSITSTDNGILSIYLSLANDTNPSDNLWQTTVGNPAQYRLCINEFLYNPQPENQEWIELYIPGGALADSLLTIEDGTENHVHIILPPSCPEYLVLCRDAADLLSRYPACPAENILEVNSLPALNNEGDIIILRDSSDAVIDSVSYLGNNARKDYSLERQSEEDSTVTWHYCFADAKGTPGLANSIQPPPPPIPAGEIRLTHSPFNPLAGESMTLEYNFKDTANTITCSVFDLNGIKRYVFADHQEIDSSGSLAWNGKDKSGKALSRGLYILRIEAENSSGKRILTKQLTVVLATQ